jgi:hypothetical protein
VTGSTFRVFAPTEDALHGKANELVTVDEGGHSTACRAGAARRDPAHVRHHRRPAVAALAPPAPRRRPGCGLRQARPRAVKAGATSGLAYFEWSLSPSRPASGSPTAVRYHRTGEAEASSRFPRAGRPLEDAVQLVLAAHPGQFVRARRGARGRRWTMPPGEFVRAYGNVWTLTADRVIPDHAGRHAVPRPAGPPRPGQLRLAFDVTLGEPLPRIGAAWRAGRPAGGRRASTPARC